MNRKLAICVMAAGAVLCESAYASGALTGRVGVNLGSYEFEDTSGSSDSFAFGALGGGRLVVGRFLTDLTVEYIVLPDEIDSLDRTDTNLTLGVFLGDSWTLFGGYRQSLFGDGFYSDKQGFSETGPFLGLGFGTTLGERVALGTSIAVNDLTYEQEGQTFDELDLLGFGLNLKLAFLGTPNAIVLRAQRLEGDLEAFNFEFSETYILIGYELTLNITSW